MAKQTDTLTSTSNDEIINKTVHIDAPTSKVWDMLTNPDLMKKWMMTDSEINIITDWKVGAPMLIRGNLHGINFENKGKVLRFELEKILQYSHLSSLSKLSDNPKNYSVLEFKLAPMEKQTTLILTISNFPTESIFKHLAFYWNVTLEIMKRMIEQQG